MYDSEYTTMQEIARYFDDSTSHTIGRHLKECGLRLANNEPSELAHQLGLVRKRPVYGREPHEVWTWHLAKTLSRLEGAGLRLKC